MQTNHKEGRGRWVMAASQGKGSKLGWQSGRDGDNSKNSKITPYARRYDAKRRITEMLHLMHGMSIWFLFLNRALEIANQSFV